jgi:predicted Zn-dependent protease
LLKTSSEQEDEFVSTKNRVKLALFLLALFLNACASGLAQLPTVTDGRLERYVTAMGLEIVAVSEHRERWVDYQFKLVNFARRDILGLSTGRQKIYISYELARLAYKSNYYRWLLRHTLAHEIAHDVLGGDIANEDDGASPHTGLANRITGKDLGLPGRVRFRPYSRAAELAADRKGMEYWEKLGWNCEHWVRLFVNFSAEGYQGDLDHPTRLRLDQAQQICTQAAAASSAPDV